MTLEERINKAIHSWSRNNPIESQTTYSAYGFTNLNSLFNYYTEVPSTITIEQLQKRNAFSDAITIIYRLIREANSSECLTSPSQLIREYRLWWETTK